MELQVVPITLLDGTWYILKVIQDGKELFYSDNFTLQSKLVMNSSGNNTVKYKNPEKFQELLPTLIKKFRWFGEVDPNQKILESELI